MYLFRHCVMKMCWQFRYSSCAIELCTGCRRILSLTSFLIYCLWIVSSTHWLEAGCSPQLVWTPWRREESLCPCHEALFLGQTTHNLATILIWAIETSVRPQHSYCISEDRNQNVRLLSYCMVLHKLSMRVIVLSTIAMILALWPQSWTFKF